MMIKGLYTAASAMVAGLNKQALKAQNVANQTTPGFKQVFTVYQEYLQTKVKPPLPLDQQPVGMLGLGVFTVPTMTKFGNGALQATEQPFDFAIQGDGFFRIKTPQGERYTRDGRFLRDANQSLVTIEGNQVLDRSGNPIQIPDGNLSVDEFGAMRIDNQTIGQLGIAEFNQPEIQLKKDGGNLYRALETPPQAVSNSFIYQGYLEMSNVNVVDSVISARTYEAAQRMVQIQDEVLGKTIGTLGKTV
jgi:flagellar basal body rod protein FlgG